VFRTDLPLRRVLIMVAVVLLCIPLYISATSWIALYGMPSVLNSTAAAAWIMGIAYVPLVILVTGVCFSASDPEQEEAAYLDTGKRGVFWYVTLRQAMWGIAVAAGFVTVFAFSLTTVTDILYIRSLAEEVLTQYSLNDNPWPAVVVSLPVTAFLCALGMLAVFFFRRQGESTTTGAGRPPVEFKLGKFRYPLLCLCLLVFGALFVHPLVALGRAVSSFEEMKHGIEELVEALWNTLWYSGTAAAISSMLGVAGAWVLLRMKRMRWVVGILLLLLITTPEPITGVGLIQLLDRQGILGAIYDSEITLIIAYVIRTLPFSVLILAASLKSTVPREFEESASLDGANWLDTMLHIVLPLNWRAVAAAWLVAFVLSLGELSTAMLVAPPGTVLFSNTFFTLIHSGMSTRVAAKCLVMLGVAVLPGILIGVLHWKAINRRLS